MNSDLEITNCVKTLRDGGIIVYPGETGWSLATDLKNIEAAQSILECDFADFKCILLHDSGLLGKYLKEAPDVLWDLVEYTSKPLQLLFENVVNVPAQLMLNNEISFRIVKDTFTKNLLYKFGKPVFTAVLKNQGQPIHDATILNKPAYVVNLRSGSKLNTENLVIIRLSPGGQIEFIKK